MSDFQISTLAQHGGGLSSKQAEVLFNKYGQNALPEKPPPSDISIFISQFKSPLVYILLIAGIVTAVLHEFTDTTVIGLAVLVNSVFGFFQERKAGRALEALKKMVHPTVQAIRDGKLQTIETEKLVPGDRVVLQQGDKVPADGQVMACNRLFVEEAMLTGESVPIEKCPDGKIFMGTVVVGGSAEVLVEVTGAKTEMGKIAQSVSESQEDTPLGKQLTKFSRDLSILVLILISIVFVIGFVTKLDVVEVFKTSVALAVSAIPEGLLVGLTVVLAIGMQRILKRRGLVRHLVSAETLGGVTVICIDKTGTLTEGKMRVTDAYGNEEAIARQVVLANDLDDPVVIASWEWGKQHIANPDRLLERHKRLDAIPFSSENQFFACLNVLKDDGGIIFVNGAPEVLLEKSTLAESEKKKVYETIEQLSAAGKRILGFARKEVGADKKILAFEDIDNTLVWEGLLAFEDPVRTDVRGALEDAQKAGIKLMVITGDYAKTAVSVLNDLGLEIDKEDIVVGKEIEKLPKEALNAKITSSNGVKLFARTKPEQKLRIVQALKDHGEVVAMMGDGVNDAPALARADIGIVVGEATDVAKESADLVLLDSSFNTIVAAIEEGRGIFDNIRKIILYLMCDAFVEILVVLGAMLFGFSLPLAAAQILWINLVSDGFPHLALTVDPKARGIMVRPPRSPREPLIARWMYELMGIVSLIGGVFSFLLYLYVTITTRDPVLARSVTFAAVGINSLVYVFSVRTLREPFWKENVLANRWLIGAVSLGFIFQLLPFLSRRVGTFLDVVPIGVFWIPVFFSALAIFFGIEISKHFFAYKRK
ncbi:HAD-IC family P-type ATPase [bacterium]|nr:HAD-IC family P-type ATPase [bacterium]